MLRCVSGMLKPLPGLTCTVNKSPTSEMLSSTRPRRFCLLASTLRLPRPLRVLKRESAKEFDHSE
jgi:hypothetical protein